ncbi:MFS transporter [Arachnia propionica]|uniref:MFS transporter n=1 Tax=Arachnia propionica TaxID=1750 RepID=A0A3P1WTK1_9ACTN|nr:MFS transporter [Arachnia propionica]RRD49336.1 MFS transporter [Arachnia propionica]
MDPQAPTLRTWLGLWVLAAALAVIVIDGTIVGVALPTIIDDLGLGLTGGQWVNSLYSVVFAALLLTFGRLGDRYGRRRMLLIGMALFIAGSILGGLATGPAPLISGRAIQGVGGAMILPATLSTVNATFRGPHRATAFGIWGAVMAGAAALGPLVGGWLTHVADWRWVFWVNLPLGLAVMAAAWRVVPETRSQHSTPLEPFGPLLSAIGFGSLIFGLIEGTDLGWWRPRQELRVGNLTWGLDAPVSPAPVAILVGLAVLVWFVLREHRRRDLPHLVTLSLFRIPTFATGNLTAALVQVGEYILIFVLPIHLVTGMGADPLTAGLVLMAMALGAFVSGGAARFLAMRLSTRRVVQLGLALEVVGLAATAVAIQRAASPLWLTAAMLPYGIGLGLAAAQLTSLVLHDVPIDTSGQGSALQSTIRQVGAAIGSAVGGTVMGAVLAGTPIGEASPDGLAHASSVAMWLGTGTLVVAFLTVPRAAMQGSRSSDASTHVE